MTNLPLPVLSDRHRALYDALQSQKDYPYDYGAGLVTGPQSALLKIDWDRGCEVALEINGTLYKAGAINQAHDVMKELQLTVIKGDKA